MPISQPTFKPGQLTFTGAQNTKITNLVMASANTEYSLSLTSNLKQLVVRARGMSRLQIAFTSTESGTKYLTVPKGTTLTLDELTLSTTIYVQANKAGETAELLELY